MSKELSNRLNVFLPILVSLGGVLSMSLVGYLLREGVIPTIPVTKFPLLNLTFTMQMLMLLASMAGLAFAYVFNTQSFWEYFRWAMWNREGSEWNLLGPIIAIALTIGTTVMMSSGVISQNGAINETFFELLPYVMLFAATNAWIEEIFTRFVVVSGLHERVSPLAICGISASVFGLPHYFGTPSGLFGVVGAGLMGWLLAKSVLETRGIGWALTIHWLQDVVIFGAGAMIIAGNGN